MHVTEVWGRFKIIIRPCGTCSNNLPFKDIVVPALVASREDFYRGNVFIRLGYTEAESNVLIYSVIEGVKEADKASRLWKTFFVGKVGR